MTSNLRWITCTGVGLAIHLFAGHAVQAETIAFSTELSGAAQVPANPSKGTGMVSATYDADSKLLSWSGRYTGTTGQPIAMHFHGPADADKNGPIVVNFEKFVSPFEGKATLTDQQAADLLAGKWYANLHTPSYPGGELRGQMVRAKDK